MSLRNTILIAVAGAAASLLGSVANATSYYISSSTGNDSNNGLTAAAAWQSIGKINSTSFAVGDRVYLKAGDTFTGSGAASFNVSWSGTATTHAVLGAYHTDAGGNAVIGLGSGTRPLILSSNVFTTFDPTHPPPAGSNANTSREYVPGLLITGSYVEVRDVETSNWGYGLQVDGTSNITLDNLRIAAPYDCGIFVRDVDTITVSNSEVYADNSGYGTYHDTQNHWCSGINVQYSTHFTIHGNFVHEGFGEGILPFRASTFGDISNNTVFSQRAVGIYTGWAQNLNIHANLVLGTSNSTYWRFTGFTGPGIAMENEDTELTSGKVKDSDALQNIAVYDNLVAGTYQGFAIWHSTSPPSNGGAVVNVSVYNNTLVDNGTQIAPSKCNGCIAENNILLSLSSGAVDQNGGGSGGVVFHNNYWSKGNPGTGLADAATDVYSGLTLTKMTGWRSIANAGSLPTWTAFSPLSGSSTFQEGTALLAAPYNVDFNGSPHRNPMDMGALAGSGGVVAPVAAFSCTPLTGTAPLAITCSDASTNSPTAWSWTFGDSGTSTSRNPTHSYSAAGTYTIALTASNSGGSNTLTKTGYVTVSSGGSSGSVTPNPASAGQTITISDTFTATVTDSTADIVFWVKNTAGTVIARCGNTSTSITSGQPKTLTCSVALPATAASGSYPISGTVYQSATNQTGIQSIPVFATLTIQ
jgi:PKD repeat protein